MKKILIILMLFIVFLIIYFLQSSFFSWFVIANVMPNLFVIFILSLSVFLGKTYGVAIGVFAGVLIDFFIRKINRSNWNNAWCSWVIRRPFK